MILDTNINTNALPDRIYKESIIANNISLKEFTGKDTYMFGDMETVRFFNKDKTGKMLAVSIDIPYYEKEHPEKMEATKYNIFTVFEYTKREAYTTREIDWNYFKEKFKDALIELYKHCM